MQFALLLAECDIFRDLDQTGDDFGIFFWMGDAPGAGFGIAGDKVLQEIMLVADRLVRGDEVGET